MKKLTSILVVMALVFVFTVTGSAALVPIGTAQFDVDGPDGPTYPLLWDEEASVIWLDYTAIEATQPTQVIWAANLNTVNPLNLTFDEGVTVAFTSDWRLAESEAEYTVGLRTSGGVGFLNLVSDLYWSVNRWETSPGFFNGQYYNPLASNGYNSFWDDWHMLYGLALRSATVEILAVAPSVATQAATAVASTTATGNGNITALGSSNPTQHGICWSTSTDPTVDDINDFKTTDGAVSATGSFTSSMTGLTPGTLYNVRAYATNSAGTSYGTNVTFTTLAPEINLKQNTINIADGGSHDFGSQATGTDTDLIFTIENTGTADLALSGTPIIAITGADSSQFSVQTQPISPVTGSSSTTFTIRFSPTSTGAKTATIAIANNDSDENPYDLTITGTGTTAVVQVFSEHRVYDSCFTYGEGYYTILSVVLSSPSGCNPKAVRMSWPGNEWILPFLPGWSNRSRYAGKLVFAKGIGGPAPGSDWEEKTYIATVDCDDEMYSTFTPPAGTYQQLEVPVEVNVTNGNTPSVTWSEVAGADKYSVRLFPLNSDGNPDMSTLVYDSGLIVTTSHILTGLEGIVPGCYALCIESRDYLDPPLEEQLVNRSRYLTRIFIGECNDQAFESANVYSEHRVYDSCFTNEESCFMKIGAVLSGSCTPHPVRVEWDGGNQVLTPWPDWNCCSFVEQYVFSKNFGALGSEWEDKTYNFSVDCNPGVTDSVTIPTETFYCLDAPGNVVVTHGSTPSVAWSAVPEADFYKVRLYPLNNDGNPDSAILLYDSGHLTSLTHTLSGLGTFQPGMYCLSVESQDMDGERLINRGRYYTNLALGDNPDIVFDSVHVYSEHRVYDICFNSSESSFTGMAAILSTGGEFPAPVRVHWDTGDAVLRPNPGYSCCQYEGKYVVGSGFSSPPIGTDWEFKAYTFTVDYDPLASATLIIPPNTFNLLAAPATVTVVPGRQPTVNWSAVDGADTYVVRLYPLNNTGEPDTGTLVYDSGELLAITHTLTNLNSLAPGCYALCLESRESEGSQLINRSSYYTKVLINCSRHSHSVDFNGDNTSDILWSNIYSGDTAVFLMGTAGVTGILNPGTEAEIDWQVFGPGDFNGDGIADILWTNEATGELKIWFMNSEGFDHTQSVGTADLANYNLYGPADFNGDGCADLLWRHKTSGQMFFWYLDENGYAGSSYLGTVSDLTYQIYGPADFNGDGIADIMWRNSVTGVMFLWYMNTTGLDHSVYMGTLADVDWVLETFADFDDDGNCDIYLRNHTSGQMAIWHPDDNGQITSQYIGTISDMNWQITCSGDFSGDGYGDIIWRNVNTGVLFRWTFDDSGYTGSTYLGTVADEDWVIGNR